MDRWVVAGVVLAVFSAIVWIPMLIVGICGACAVAGVVLVYALEAAATGIDAVAACVRAATAPVRRRQEARRRRLQAIDARPPGSVPRPR